MTDLRVMSVTDSERGTMFDYCEAEKIVKQEIDRLYRQWGPVVNREREDLMQTGFVTLLEIANKKAVNNKSALGHIAVRRDFSDRLRSISGIRRKDKAVPSSLGIWGNYLSEVESAVHCERQLERRNCNNPTEMACIEGVASGKTIAEIAKHLGITSATVFVHCHHFRRGLASSSGG